METPQYTPEQIRDIVASQRERFIDSLLDDFDFKKMNKVMTMMDWKVINEDLTFCAPSEINLYKRARKLINDALDDMAHHHHEACTVRYGGFSVFVEILPDNDNNPKLYGRISFVVCDWDNYE